MTLPHLPVMLVDGLGALLVIGLSGATCRNFRSRAVARRASPLELYLYWFSGALFLFGLSRSAGHILKHVLLLAGRPGLWDSIYPYSGAVNTVALVFMASVTLFLRQVLVLFRRMEEDRERIRRSSKEIIRLSREMNRLIGERTRSEMALRLAHEVRNPISVIGGLLRRMDRGGVDQEVWRKRWVPAILKEAAQLEALVGRLDALFKSGAQAFEQLDLNALLPTALEGLREEAEARGVRLAVEASPAPLPFKGNARLLSICIRHLLLNALAAVRRGEGIVLRTGPTEEGVFFEVEDTGPGIPEELMAHIFEPYYEGEGGSTGLGLPFIKEVVEEHQGTLALESSPGRGTKVRVELPTYLREGE